jgi:glycosyltransferase involved in cell wall biosynthesis
MKIGVVFHGNPLAGGCFQQSLNATRLLSKDDNSSNEFLYYTPDAGNALAIKADGIQARTFKLGRKERIIHKLRKQITLNRILDKFSFFQPLDATFEKDGVDLVYFTGPSPICLFLERLNYVLTVWDLCHRDHMEFPEVRQSFEFEARENLARISFAKATAVIAESPLGKQNLERRYGLDHDRVYWISVSPALRIPKKEDSGFDPREGAGIPPDAQYVFYPAQFWAHKNHRLIVDSLSIYNKSTGEEVYAIFCGSDCGNLNAVLDMAKEKGVGSLVKYVGFVPEEQMPAFYKNSLALVMPSYFGPTNMPPLEAFAMKTPVIVTDLPGIRDQVGEAALLVAPDKPEALAKAIQTLLHDPQLRKDLITKGVSRLKEFSDKNRLTTLRKIFNAYNSKRLSWSVE